MQKEGIEGRNWDPRRLYTIAPWVQRYAVSNAVLKSRCQVTGTRVIVASSVKLIDLSSVTDQSSGFPYRVDA
jgi:hypothetical protein